ncbi:hypothetical protein niasHT_005912 [Heterodera trifolii]|uniref:Uncharacterized protein n=1 Tax=Heterodera trifolii TaxID=157864 RepID=A0ABD2LX82_9BILA
MAKEFRLGHHFERSFLDAPPPPPCASKLAHPGSAAMARGGPRRPDDGMVGRGPRQWREGVRADDRQNGGEGAAAVERGCPWKRGGPRCPAKGRGATRGEGSAPFNAKYRDPAHSIGGRLVNASGQPPSRVQSRAAKLPRI